jgi:hypothetical protein
MSDHTADCPTPDALLAALRGEGAEGQRLRVLDRALQCDACRREMALLHAVSEPPRRAVVARPWVRTTSLAIAASALLAVGLYGVRRRDGRDEVTRAGPAELTLVAPAPGSVRGDSVAFVWRPVAGAFEYTLEVDAADGAVLLTRSGADTAVVAPLPGAALGELRWSVRARLDDGSERRSESRPLRLTR